MWTLKWSTQVRKTYRVYDVHLLLSWTFQITYIVKLSCLHSKGLVFHAVQKATQECGSPKRFELHREIWEIYEIMEAVFSVGWRLISHEKVINDNHTVQEKNNMKTLNTLGSPYIVHVVKKKYFSPKFVFFSVTSW